MPTETSCSKHNQGEKKIIIMLITILSMSLCNVLYLITELFKRKVKQIKQQSSYSNILFFRGVLQHPYDSWIMNNLNLVSRF